MNKLGDYIKAKRESKGLSKRALADAANISHTEIHRIEKGQRKNPSVPVLKSIAAALNIPSEELLQMAGYIENLDISSQQLEFGLKQLTSKKQKDAALKIIKDISENDDLSEDDFQDIIRQVEICIELARRKK
ncbi:helix-turn-helix domain-containing protein [Zhaonella formicivorans]|uniref:helix-turn-helix domain-containing protein n=1 Tax=Zhaonella formicivorans TaxID=2528593 RepID=UPI0010D1D651|nr:helix-turn-helix transcriptional regulator [Zhaonella formicivorans]